MSLIYWFHFLWIHIPAVGLQDQMVVLLSVFKEIIILFSIVAILICIPTIYEVLFLCFLTNICYAYLFDNILMGVRWCRCGFDLHFLDDWWCWTSYSYREQTGVRTSCNCNSCLHYTGEKIIDILWLHSDLILVCAKTKLWSCLDFSHFIMVSEWPCLVLIFCEITQFNRTTRPCCKYHFSSSLHSYSPKCRLLPRYTSESWNFSLWLK
jgi:hypothetical protein